MGPSNGPGERRRNRTFAEKLRPDPLNCSKPESRDARCSATCRRAIKKMMNMHSSNASLESYAGPDKTTSAVQLEELRNIRRASSILHYPRTRQPWVGVLRWALNIRVRLFWVPFAELKTGNSTGRVPTKARV